MNAQTVQNLTPGILADNLTFSTHRRPERHVACFRWAVEIGSCASHFMAAKPALKFIAGGSQQGGTGMIVQTNVAIPGPPLIIAPSCTASSRFSILFQVQSVAHHPPYGRMQDVLKPMTSHACFTPLFFSVPIVLRLSCSCR